MREYRATSLARVTNTETPESLERDSTDCLTSRSSIPPPRKTRTTTALPLFQALTTSLGRPGPGVSAAGVTEPDGGTTAVPALGTAPADAVPVDGRLEVAPAEVAGAVAAGVFEAAVAGVEALFFFRFIIRNRPTTTTRTPRTAIWTTGLLFSACLIAPQLPRRRCRRSARSRSRAGPWRRA